MDRGDFQRVYVYVTRHPASWFSSIADFTALLMGPFAQRRDKLLDWYLSDEMWWRSWPEHVAGAFLKDGSRYRERAAEERERILRFCEDRLAGRAYPLRRFYPAAPAG